MENIINKIIGVAKALDWNVDNDGEYITFSQYSPAGQDFSFIVGLEETEDENEQVYLLIEGIYSCYDDYDPSKEAYYWLDGTGHGTNGAPYEMIDVYNDMVACQNMVYQLYNELHDYYYKEIYSEE